MVGGDFDLIIEPEKGLANYWRDLWSFRSLFYFLSWRDILVRYKQTVVGVAWAVLRPLIAMTVLVIVFGKLAKLPSGGAPYPILVFAAMLPWQFFASGLTESSNSLVVNANMLSKVYFPRLIVPTSAIIVSLVDFLVSFAILMAMMLLYQFPFSWRFLTLPAFLVLALVPTLGLGYWLSALNVKYRDFRHVVPFLVQIGLYISPVGFSSDIVPDRWRMLYSLNPMVGVIDGFRWAILGQRFELFLPGLMTSSIVGLILCGFGLAYFRRAERHFADVI